MDVNLHYCLEGDKQAWDAFVQRYSGVIYAAVGRVGGSRSAGSTGRTTEDVAQEVFVRLIKDDYRLLRKFEPQRASLETWLTLVARSVAIDCLRKRRLETSGLDSSQIPAAEPTPDGQTVPLHLLTARQRLVLTLLFDEDRSVAEAAQMLSVDEQTIRSTKHKALSRLRSHFQSR
ncbi:MAG: sigma-70 family RNA polymerase sigma factor [Phycisphaerales bacterium]